MTLGEYLIHLLGNHGVDHVFGIPGVHTVELYRGLARGPIRHVLARHEQGAGFMADGYARATGKPGVCLVITGPGLTNIITAMGQAYSDSIPMLVISGVNRRADLDHSHGFLHEMPDQQSVVRAVCAFSHRVQSAAELPGVLARAFAVFSGGRPRPVHIEIPIDVMTMPVTAGAVPPAAIAPAAVAPRIVTDILARAAEARRPLALIGGGCRAVPPGMMAAAVDAIGAPAVLTINGRDRLDGHHPLAVPASPSLDSVRDAMNEADLLLVFGSEIGRTDYDMFAAGMPQVAAPIIRVDIDPRQLVGSQFAGRDGSADLLVAADAAAVLADIAGRPACLAPHHARAAALRAAALAELTPTMRAGVALLDRLRSWLPGAILVGDSTQPVYAGNLYHGVDPAGRWFNSSVGFGTLGYAVPAAIGAKLGSPHRAVVALVGDGGLQFTIGELAAIPSDRPVIVIVWNNDGYGEIRSSMEAADVDPVGVDAACPDLGGIAAAYRLDFAAPMSLDALGVVLTAPDRATRSILIELDETLFYRALGV